MPGLCFFDNSSNVDRGSFVKRAFQNMVFWGKTYDVSPYDSQWLHPSMNLDVQWDLCVLFLQTAVKCQDCKFV